MGASLAEAYPIMWCSVEYYESTGSVLHNFLNHISPNGYYHIGRTLLHHAILCNNQKALSILLHCNADPEAAFQTKEETKIFPIHLAARLGFYFLTGLINASCYLNSVTKSGDSTIMICVRYTLTTIKAFFH